jgi:hypothetical protein
MQTAHRRSVILLCGSILLLVAATVAGVAAYAIYDQRQEIHALQSRLAVVGQRSERAALATRAVCSALATLQKSSTRGIASLARLTEGDCAPILELPPPR